MGVGSKGGGLVGDGSRVFVGGTDVAVGGRGVWVGGTGVLVGGTAVFDGGTLVFGGRQVRDGTGVGTLVAGAPAGAFVRVGLAVRVGVLDAVAVGVGIYGMYNVCPPASVSVIRQLAACSSFGLIFICRLSEARVSVT